VYGVSVSLHANYPSASDNPPSWSINPNSTASSPSATLPTSLQAACRQGEKTGVGRYSNRNGKQKITTKESDYYTPAPPKLNITEGCQSMPDKSQAPNTNPQEIELPQSIVSEFARFLVPEMRMFAEWQAKQEKKQ